MMDFIKKNAPIILGILIIVILNFLYFAPQFDGKIVQQGDIINVRAMAHEAKVYGEKDKEPVLWTNSMFGGMPTYQISAPLKNNFIGYVDKLLSFNLAAPAGFFISGMLCFFFSLLFLGINPWLSLIGALIFGFSTNNLILFEAGHMTKLKVIMFSAPIIIGLILTFRKQFVTGGILFAVSLALNIMYNHIQMSYYLALILIPLVIIYLVSAIKNKEVIAFFKSSAILLFGTILALGSSASKLWTTYEYAKDTMRGKPILEATSDTITSSSEVDGLEYNYAMAWSNGGLDLISSFIPLVAGGSSAQLVDKDSPLAKRVGARKAIQAPTYYGSLPFTSGPAYFGAVAFFLFLLGAFIVKGRFKWWLVFATIFTFLLSMGKNLDFFNRFLFDYLPLYNKFRTPNSVLSVTAVIIPILAVLGLSELIKSEDKKSYIKPLYITTAVLGGFCVVLWLLGPAFIDFESASDQRYKEIADALIEQREAMLASSSLRTLLLILLSAVLIYFFLLDKINKTILLISIGALAFLDLLMVDKDYLGKDSFVNERNYKNNFEPRPVDQQIKSDPDPHFRVYDASLADPYQNAMPSYHHKMVGGYHAAKLQRIQDVIDRHLSKGNMEVFNMLNTKYFIIKGEGENLVPNINNLANGNAWFVDNVKLVENANAEIDSLTKFNSKKIAFVNKEFQSYIADVKPADSSATIKLTSYHPNKITYEAMVGSGNPLAVFSEVWYGPDKGWQAYIDDQAVDHIRVNYILRALKVPQGKHTIVFEFKPKSFFLGETISLITSLMLLIIGIGAGIYIYFGTRKKLNSLS